MSRLDTEVLNPEICSRPPLMTPGTLITHYFVFVFVQCFSLCLAVDWLCLCHALSGGVMSYHSAMFCCHDDASAVDLGLTKERLAKSGLS